jgi:hypothetical protein
MKLEISWQMVIVYSVAFVVTGGLIWKGIVPAVTISALLAWLVPSPLQKKPEIVVAHMEPEKIQ